MSKRIPKLRFKEFSGKWELKRLNELLEFKNGINASKEQYGSGFKFINVLDILNNDFITYDSIIGSVNVDQKVFEKNQVNYGDILFQRSSETREEVGTASVYLDSRTVTFGGFVIRGKKIGNYDPVFFNKLLKTNLSRNEITSKSGGSTRYNVGQETLSSVVLPFPTLPEQHKIASFLSAVDEKIQQLTRKKELLEQYKKGVMQQLFSGKVRFKDANGKAYPKWEEKRLGQVGNTFNGLTGKTKENFGTGKPYIQYMQIFANSKIDVTKCGLVQIGKDENQKVVQYGDVFFTTSSETPDEIGTCSVLLDEVDEMYLNSFCFGFRPNSFDILVPSFAAYLFRNEIFRKLIIRLAQGSTRYNMSKVQLLKLKVQLPSKEEQQKIANCLSAIDAKIESVSTQIIQTQTFKKGLLQQMFV